MTCCLVHRNLKIFYGMILNGTINNVDYDNITCLFGEMMAACDVSYIPGLKLATSGKGD